MTVRLSRLNLDSRLQISWGICFKTSSPWGCIGPPVMKARYNIIFKSFSTKSASRWLTPIIIMHTIPRNMDTWVMRSKPLMWLRNKWSTACYKLFVLAVKAKNLPVLYCTGSLGDMIVTSDRWASKRWRTSTTAVLRVFTTGMLRLIEVRALCQALTSCFISEIFSGEGMHMSSFADERIPDSMWLSWASAVFVCWLRSALLDAWLDCWSEAELWLIGDNVGDEISERGVSSKSWWNSSSTPVKLASGDNPIHWTPAMMAWMEPSSDDAESGGAPLLWVVKLNIEGSSNSVVVKSCAPAASAC